LSFLPKEERNLVSAKVSPTMWQAVRETMEQMHGNTSIDIPNRNVENRIKTPGNNNKGR